MLDTTVMFYIFAAFYQKHLFHQMDAPTIIVHSLKLFPSNKFEPLPLNEKFTLWILWAFSIEVYCRKVS